MTRIGYRRSAAVALVLLTVSGCATTEHGAAQPDQTVAATPPPPPPPPAPPPVDLAGKWKFTVAKAGGCTMTISANAGAADGSIAPAGGCPGDFFTSRKWTYEHDRLIVRDHKGGVLVELAFVGGHFEGQTAAGAAVTLNR